MFRYALYNNASKKPPCVFLIKVNSMVIYAASMGQRSCIHQMDSPTLVSFLWQVERDYPLEGRDSAIDKMFPDLVCSARLQEHTSSSRCQDRLNDLRNKISS